MKKLSLLTILVAGFVVCHAQPDSLSDNATDPVLEPHAGGSIVIAGFTATVKGSDKVWLRWNADSAGIGDYFIAERSADGEHYETIGVVRETGANGHYEFTDGAPPAGADYYRIKCSPATGPPVYSKAMLVSLSGTVDFKFYPNPVDRVLIVRTEHSIDLAVMDAAGAIRVSKRLQPGIQIIDVSSLENGVYVLRVTDKESNRAVSRQLVKN